jgi:hypothetical protein
VNRFRAKAFQEEEFHDESLLRFFHLKKDVTFTDSEP